MSNLDNNYDKYETELKHKSISNVFITFHKIHMTLIYDGWLTTTIKYTHI